MNPSDSDAPRSRSSSQELRPGDAGHGVSLCDLCGAQVLDRHCKIVCQNCGYMRDCSDP